MADGIVRLWITRFNESGLEGLRDRRRGYGYVFGAFVTATGETFTHPYPGRTTANRADFLDQVEG